MKRHSLRKKSRDLSNDDFAMMTNEEFEVAFDTSNRNNKQQYALLFTPLAQESMMNLLKDDKVGFGDDFDFGKQRMINVIFSNHMQSLNLDMNPQQYKGFDYDKAETDFYAINSRYFRAIYFCREKGVECPPEVRFPASGFPGCLAARSPTFSCFALASYRF